MKKGVFAKITAGLGASLTGLLSMITAEEVATAGQTNFQAWGQNLAQGVSKLFEQLKISPDAPYFSMILLAIILWIVIYTVVKQFFKSNDMLGLPLAGIMSLVITILVFINLPKDFVAVIVTQYQAMGATILTLVPFIIMIWFTVWVTDSLIVARIIWIVYAAYYFTLFIYKIGESTTATGEGTPATYFYLIAVIIGILIVFMIRGVRWLVIGGKIETQKEKGQAKVRKAKAGADILATAAEEFSHGGGI